MSSQKQQYDEISLIDILLFLKASGRNVLISSVACLTVGVAYYLAVPKMYEASATIQMAMVAGDLVEAPVVLFEKIKLPLFFSKATFNACGSEGEHSSQKKFADKLKTVLNKSAPFISLSVQARSAQEARACLDAVISEIQQSQDLLAKPLLEQKKQKIAQLSDQFKFAADMAKSFATTKANKNATDAQFSARTLVLFHNQANASEMSDLRRKINNLEAELVPPQTQPLSLAVPIFVPEVHNDKRPMLTLGLIFGAGSVLGLLITVLQQLVPKIRLQVRNAKSKRF